MKSFGIFSLNKNFIWKLLDFEKMNFNFPSREKLYNFYVTYWEFWCPERDSMDKNPHAKDNGNQHAFLFFSHVSLTYREIHPRQALEHQQQCILVLRFWNFLSKQFSMHTNPYPHAGQDLDTMPLKKNLNYH